MRSILVGMAVVMVGLVVPAYGGSIVDDSERRPGPAHESVTVERHPTVERDTVIHDTPPFGDVVVEEYHSAGAELGMGVAATIFSVFYHPVKLVVGVVGAELGGVEGWLTGGDIRTAKSMWRPTVEGDYFVRPDHLDHTERFEVGNFRPVAREHYTVIGRRPAAFEEREQAPTVVYEDHEVEVAPAAPPSDSTLEVEDDSSDR
jgi:hypothetical protein